MQSQQYQYSAPLQTASPAQPVQAIQTYHTVPVQVYAEPVQAIVQYHPCQIQWVASPVQEPVKVVQLEEPPKEVVKIVEVQNLTLLGMQRKFSN